MSRAILLAALLFTASSAFATERDFVPVCQRSLEVQNLLNVNEATCRDILEEDLAQFSTLEFHSTEGFRPGDFTGFSNLLDITIITPENKVTSGILRGLPQSLTRLRIEAKSIELTNEFLATLPRLTELELEGPFVPPPRFFEELPQLESLTLNKAQIGNSIWKRIARFGRLESLVLFELPITYVDAEVLRSMQSLNTLGLSGPTLKKENIDWTVFDDLPNLKLLALVNLKLSTLPPSVGKSLRRLTLLSLAENPITKIDPAFFSHLTSLEILVLDKTHLTSISAADVEVMPKLQNLQCEECMFLDRIEDFAFINLRHFTAISLLKAPLRKTRKAAFRGVEDVTGLPANFDQDGAEWSGP